MTQLQDAILNILVEQGGETSLSHLRTELRYKNIRLLGDVDDVQNAIKGAGFTITPIYRPNSKIVSKTLISL